MVVFGYLGALLVGLSLGILGAGGSIIAIPVLIYLFKIDPILATTYSFFIVGSVALTGSIQHIRKGQVKLMPALYFAVSGVISIYLIRTYILKLIPEVLFMIGTVTITKEIGILIFFSIVMAFAGISMIRSAGGNRSVRSETGAPGFMYLILLGFGVGIIIAIAGVGGGFLITPALILFARLPVKTAIGTSLCIISLNSFVGFFSSLHLHPDIDWQFLFLFIAVTLTGLFAGGKFAGRLNADKLKVIFGWFVLAMSIFMIINELYLKV